MNLLAMYTFAKEAVIASGWQHQIDWQASRNIDDVTEQEFLRDYAWVVMNSGMRFNVTKKLFPKWDQAFHEFKRASVIVAWENGCRAAALEAFGHKGKVEAVITTAKRIDKEGWPTIRKAIKKDPLVELKTFPFLGDVTKYHMAKNLGVDVAKPDRHLVRIADLAGEGDVQTFCRRISELSGDKVPVVDIVLWRYATIDKDYRTTLRAEMEK